jgi:hypothetical protein
MKRLQRSGLKSDLAENANACERVKGRWNRQLHIYSTHVEM